jgi:YwiC-like protein
LHEAHQVRHVRNLRLAAESAHVLRDVGELVQDLPELRLVRAFRLGAFVATTMMVRRSLWPREHGAYFQLGIPLLTASLRHAPSMAMVALTLAAGLAFLANEPLLVVLGHRGSRMRDTEGRRARFRLAILAAGAAGLGGVGLALAPSGTILGAGLVAAPVAAMIALAWRRAQHTLVGEVIAAVALTGASVPVLAAGGTAPTAALAIWLGWSVGFASTVLAIHRVIARHKRPASSIDRVTAVGLVAILVASIAAAWTCAALAIAVPLTALAAILVIAPPAASRLRTVGVAIVSASIGSSAVALFGAAS